MNLLHLSDLHLGKRLNGFSLLADQEYILSQILQMVDTYTPDAVLIAGDVYDKPVPPTEAVQCFDAFLVSLAERGTQVFVISGNHDSAERTAFGARLMARSGVHFSPVYDGTCKPLALHDAHGTVYVHLLPFIKPAHVRRFFETEEIASYTDALRVAIAQMQVDETARNVLVTHQFFTGAVQCESEELSVGGTDQVDVAVVHAFDYVALGHLHGPQAVGRTSVRYCGTPLKYSVSEATHEKSATLVRLGAKGSVQIETLPLLPLRDLRAIRGDFATLTDADYYTNTSCDDYLQITLTDEQDVPEAMAQLRMIYPHVMQVLYDNTRTRASAPLARLVQMEQKAPLALFDELYEKQNGQPMDEEQRAFCGDLIAQIWEETV